MAEHEPSTGKSDDWYTPQEYFCAIGLRYALDPCSPGPGHWVPADKIYTKVDDGLSKPWNGLTSPLSSKERTPFWLSSVG